MYVAVGRHVSLEISSKPSVLELLDNNLYLTNTRGVFWLHVLSFVFSSALYPPEKEVEMVDHPPWSTWKPVFK